MFVYVNFGSPKVQVKRIINGEDTSRTKHVLRIDQMFCSIKYPVNGVCMPKHRQDEFLKFLKEIDKETPSNIDPHLIVDNSGSYKAKRVKEWLAKHPRLHMHFTPTAAERVSVKSQQREPDDVSSGAFRPLSIFICYKTQRKPEGICLDKRCGCNTG